MACIRIGIVGAGATLRRQHVPGLPTCRTQGAVRHIVGEDSIVGARGSSPAETIPLPDDTVRQWTVKAGWIRALRDGRPASPSAANVETQQRNERIHPGDS